MNPYLIKGPALISFSGGRTSAYMLYQILRAHEGKLPDDVYVAFANTGKEREETLRFIHECGSRWGVHIHWLERLPRGGMDFVGYNSASRNGEPFAALIREKQRLPNWQERWCTEHLKVRMLFALAASFGWGVGQYTEVIGLRHDEGLRIFKGMENAEKHGRRVAYPLAKARATKRGNVLPFWFGKSVVPAMPVPVEALPQGFDLGLADYEGNCDLCFLKGRGIRKRIIREGKVSAIWWADQERQQEGVFDRRDRVVELIKECRRAPDLFDADDDFEYDVECGLTCAPMERV